MRPANQLIVLIELISNSGLPPSRSKQKHCEPRLKIGVCKVLTDQPTVQPSNQSVQPSNQSVRYYRYPAVLQSCTCEERALLANGMHNHDDLLKSAVCSTPPKWHAVPKMPLDSPPQRICFRADNQSYFRCQNHVDADPIDAALFSCE